MTMRDFPQGLELTEEEAFALLGLCLTSPNKLDVVSEKALKKLAEYCSHSNHNSYNSTSYHLTHEFDKAGVQ